MMAVDWGLRVSSDLVDPFWGVHKLAHAVRNAPGWEQTAEWGAAEAFIKSLMKHMRSSDAMGISSIASDFGCGGLPGGILCSPKPDDGQGVKKDWVDPNPDDPDWRLIVETEGSNLHRGGDYDYNPVETGCDCYHEDGMTEVPGKGAHGTPLYICWRKTRCYGPDCEFYYLIVTMPCKPWWHDLPPCPLTENAIAADKDFCFEGHNRHHPGSRWCWRQVVPNGGPGQQCCYDSDGDLITEGAGAGTPDKVAVARASHLMPENRTPVNPLWRWCTIDPTRVMDHVWADVDPVEVWNEKQYLWLWPPSGSAAERLQRAVYKARSGKR